MPVTQKTDPREGHQKPAFEEPHQAAWEARSATGWIMGEESYRRFGRMKGKCALITGGDSGIGKAGRSLTHARGARIAVSFLPEEQEDAQDTLRWIEQAGSRGLLLPSEIGDEGHCVEIVNRTSQVFGALDVLVNNAAYQMTHESIEEFRSGEWDLTFRTNIYAMFYLSKAPCRGYARMERSSTRPRSRHTSRPESCWRTPLRGEPL